MSRAGAAALVLAAGLLTGCSLAEDVTPPPALATAQAAAPATPAAPTPAAPRAPADLAAGAALYGERCAPCHGPAGLGDGAQAAALPFPPAALAQPDLARRASPTDWYQMVTAGDIERFMPGFASLSDAQRWDVVAYAFSLSTTAGEVGRGRELFARACAECHTGAAALDAPARLAGLSAAALHAVISAGRPPAMPGFAETLSDEERWALAAYLRSLAFGSAAAPLPAVEAATPAPEAPSPEPAPPTPEAPALGTVRGQVVNGTTGAAPPRGLTVTLYAVDGESEHEIARAAVDAEGRFVIEGVAPAAERLYYAVAEYQGVEYLSPGAHFLPELAAPLELPLVVFETTTDRGAARVAQLHWIVLSPEPGLLRASEVWVFSNLGDRTLALPEGQALLEIALPDGAQLLEIRPSRASDRFALTAGGFSYATDLEPGTSSAQLIVTYDLPFDGRAEFAQPLDLAVQSVVILAGPDALTVRGAGISDAGATSMGGLAMRQYLAGPLAAGETLAFAVGAPAFPLEALIGGAVLLAAVAAAAIGWLRRRPRPARAAEAPPPDRQALLLRIAALDDDFEAGRAPEAEYRRRREALKRAALAADEAERD